MKRISGIILILIVLAAFTPLCCFAASLTCDDFQKISTNAECTTTPYGEGDSFNLEGEFTLDLNNKSLNAQAITCATGASCSLTITGTGILESGIFLGDNGDLTINGGTVTATGEGFGISGRTVTINDGIVEANATAHNGKGINGSSSVAIYGGTVTATGGNYGIYSGGSVTITGNADVQNTALISGAAVNIEGSANLTTGIGSIFGRNSVVISGGTVTANGSNSVIYTDNQLEISGGIVSGGSITISGAQTQVTANAPASTASDKQTGIYASGNIEIQGGTVSATGDDYGIYSLGSITINEESGTTRVTAKTTKLADVYLDGIYAAGNIEIQGGTVEATGYIGIHSRSITIKGGEVTANANLVDGINAESVDISGGTVKATGSDYGITSDKFTIYAGDVTAAGGNTGINCSKSLVGGDRGVITINGGTVRATGRRSHGIQGEIVTINEGTVTAKVTEYDAGNLPSGIFIENIMTVNGGEVTATSGWYGIEGDVDINGGTVTAAGEYSSALTGSVKNAIPGIGWSDTAGTGNEKFIGLPEYPNTGQKLDFYRKVRFPTPAAAVTFTVENGKWDDGTKENKTVTLYSGQDGTWTLPGDKIPAAGSNPDTGFMEGSWNPVPSADMEITVNKTFTYTYEKKPAAVVTTAPTAQDLTYSGEAQELVTAGTASGGTMRYALGTDADTAPENNWDTTIPTGTGVETYYVWYKAVGDPDHNDSVPKCVQVRIKDESELPAPKFDPAPGSYDSAQTVTISCTEAGASIYYTTDGSEPTVSSTRYSGPIEVSESLTIKAVAVKENMKDSAVTIGTYTIKAEDTMELPAEISVVQGNGEKGVPEDVKAQTIRLTIRLKQNGELKLSSAPIELAVTPGGYVKPADDRTITFTPNVPDFKETCGNYEYEVTVTPKEVKADIAGAGDDGPAYLLKAAAGSPDCEKFVITLYWNSKAAAPVPEVIRVVALPEDEIGAYQLRADGTKEYLLFQTYDICMAYLGSDALCAGPERCYHK